jgi:hypothetical protein
MYRDGLAPSDNLSVAESIVHIRALASFLSLTFDVAGQGGGLGTFVGFVGTLRIDACSEIKITCLPGNDSLTRWVDFSVC